MAGRILLHILLYATLAWCMAVGSPNNHDNSGTTTTVKIPFPGNSGVLSSLYASVVEVHPSKTTYFISAHSFGSGFTERAKQTGSIVVDQDRLIIVNTITSRRQSQTQSWATGTKDCSLHGKSSAFCTTSRAFGYNEILGTRTSSHRKGNEKIHGPTAIVNQALTITAGAQKLKSSTSSSSGDDSNEQTKIGVGVSLGCVALIGILVGAWIIIRRRYKRRQQDSTEESREELSGAEKKNVDAKYAPTKDGESSNAKLTSPIELGDGAIEELEPNDLGELDGSAQRLELATHGSLSPQELDSKVVLPRVSLEWPSERDKPQVGFSESSPG